MALYGDTLHRPINMGNTAESHATVTEQMSTDLSLVRLCVQNWRTVSVPSVRRHSCWQSLPGTLADGRALPLRRSFLLAKHAYTETMQIIEFLLSHYTLLICCSHLHLALLTCIGKLNRVQESVTFTETKWIWATRIVPPALLVRMQINLEMFIVRLQLHRSC